MLQAVGNEGQTEGHRGVAYSLACDVMEVARPAIDAWLFDWILREPFRRSDFYEQPNGNCRILRTLTLKLSETGPIWGRLIAPWTEYVARTIWRGARYSKTQEMMPTPLTQQHRRQAKGNQVVPSTRLPNHDRVCRGCGKSIRSGRTDCAKCAVEPATKRLIEAARIGRLAGHSAAALAKESETQRQHAKARLAWDSSSQPTWLNATFYSEKILPQLAKVSTSTIARYIGVSRGYAGKIRQGYRAHPRHWETLAKVVGVCLDQPSGPLIKLE